MYVDLDTDSGSGDNQASDQVPWCLPLTIAVDRSVTSC